MKKRYKLIKEFPNCIIKKGDVVVSDSLGQYFHEKTITIFQEEDIKNFPEFWEEIKEALFITVDGVEIFEGDNFYVPQINVKGELTGSYLELTAIYPRNNDSVKRFSTKEKAQEYIDMNKPTISRKVLEDMIERINCPIARKNLKEFLDKN